MKSLDISDKGIEFIVKEETGGRDYYEKVYKSSFVWPKGFSGPTAMVGIDIGYYTEEEINKIFKPITTSEELKLIQGGRGKTGEAARDYTVRLKGITFSWEEAIQTFEEFILPKFTRLTQKTFPGSEDLNDNIKTALVSLVFNRGTSLKGSSRSEMLEIRNIIISKNIDAKKIASLFRSMKRLWDKTSGLPGRREREAKLVEAA
jgi:GH24 family phage-related lysozyme (muramidase)